MKDSAGQCLWIVEESDRGNGPNTSGITSKGDCRGKEGGGKEKVRMTRH